MRLKLKSLRLEAGFTQDELAQKLNVARTTYTNIENGNRNPSFDLFFKIKKTLKTDDDSIFLKSNVSNVNN